MELFYKHTLWRTEKPVFTFTQTETSYATFNYVVKINGTQTDTYSATYTPPPTPTFDIALTNDDLAITATLTNIVNPDPYYTLMIHDANDTHLDGHTFATGDTTVVLTWTETSYGEKTYTKLLNGASIGTETITLTDPNASTATFNPPSSYTLTGPPSNGYYPDFTVNYDASKQTGTKYYYGIGQHSGGVFSGYYFYWDSSNNTWNDAQGDDGTADPVSFSYSATPVVNGTIITGIGGQGADFIFTMSGIPIPTWTFTWDATNPSVPDGGTMEITYDGTNWSINNDSLEPDFATHATISATAVANSIAIGYYDFGAWVNGWSFPNTYTSGDVPASAISGNWASSFVSMIEQGSSSTPTVVSPLPVLSQHTQAFGMEYYQTVGTKYYYKSDSHTGTGTSITYDYETKTWNDEGSQVPYHLNTTSTFASTTSLVNPAEIHGFGSQQNHNGTRYFSVSNPYYEAPAYRTGTSQGFAFTSGTWKGYGYTAIIDDEANSSSGKLVNGVRQWEWDMPDIGGGRLYSGANNWIYFVPGTAEDNGTWYHSSTSTGGTAGTRNGRVISIGTSATFDETNAFVDGLVPYGDIP